MGTDAQWDPTAGNGKCGSGNKTGYCVGGSIVGNDPADTSSMTGPADAAAWIAHLQAAFGNAKVSGRDELKPEDVDLQRGGRKSRIGF